MTEEKTVGFQPRGRYFEEFTVGDAVISPGRTVTEADIVAFAALSGDYNQLHTDAEYAKGTIFGERIAHGLLGLAIASGQAERLGFMEGTVEAFMGLDWKFRVPIKIGDTIHVEAQVVRKKEMRRLGGGIVVFDVAVVNHGGETVQKGQWTVLIKSKPLP
ncbi:MAG: dehydratase [Chloroflexi bacterium]|nr:dehydratase [Chloroflexota bacterium]